MKSFHTLVRRTKIKYTKNIHIIKLFAFDLLILIHSYHVALSRWDHPKGCFFYFYSPQKCFIHLLHRFLFVYFKNRQRNSRSTRESDSNSTTLLTLTGFLLRSRNLFGELTHFLCSRTVSDFPKEIRLLLDLYAQENLDLK